MSLQHEELMRKPSFYPFLINGRRVASSLIIIYGRSSHWLGVFGKGLLIFACLSLVAHISVAAFFMSAPDAALEERGAGVASLEIGNLFDASASQAVKATPLQSKSTHKAMLEPRKVQHAIETKSFVEERVKPRLIEARRIPAPSPAPFKALAANNARLLKAKQALIKPDYLKPEAMAESAKKEIQPTP
jgi:protein TonB